MCDEKEEDEKMKEFNTTGTCFPDRHYMVDISERLARIKTMVDGGKYFCINRGRQYGKTTTLEAIPAALDDYTVFSISFERMAASAFESLETVLAAFCRKLDFVLSRLLRHQDRLYGEFLLQQE